MAQETLSFLGMVNIGVRLVREQYPDAQLYEADGVPSGGPTTDPNAVDTWRLVFQAGRGTAIIKSTEWGEFGPVEYIAQPWLEDVVIPWPIDLELDEAATLMRNAGYDSAYGAVTLRWPLYPGVKQPFYIFGLVDGTYVFVGVYDRSVSTHP